MSASPHTSPGLLGSVRRVLDTGLGLAHNRLELFALEIQEEKIRFAELTLLVCALTATALLALTLISLTVVLLFWENGRLQVLATLSIVYAGGTLWLWRNVNHRLHKDPKPFSATLDELEKDKACLADK